MKMLEYFAYRYDGPRFEQLGAAHIGALVAIFCLVMASWRLPSTDRQRQAIRWGLAGLLLVNELFWYVWHAWYGLSTVQTKLPLEICNIMVLLGVFTLLTKNQVGYEFLYLLGIPAACMVLVTPALGPYGFPHILFFQIFISHGGIVLAALYLTLGEKMRPASWRALGRVALWTSLYACMIFFLNPVLGSNYLFLAHKPNAQTLLDYLGPWPWYAISMEGLGLALGALMYLPFAVKK